MMNQDVSFFIISAAVAHLVECHLAKVEVASSSLVGRSINGVVSIAPDMAR